jgi:hypothetical protein
MTGVSAQADEIGPHKTDYSDGGDAMSRTPVFIGLDCEDTFNPQSDDALLELCRIHSDAGVPLNLFTAGQKARYLRLNARHDVIAAMRDHDICYHGNFWFEYPEPAAVYGVKYDWDTALAKALSIEVPGLNEVAEVTGQFPTAFVSHECNHSPATTHAMRLGGVRAVNGGFGDDMPHNAWVMDMLFAGRAKRTVGYQGNFAMAYDPLHPERLKPAVDPDEELRDFEEAFDRQLEKGHDHVSIVGHPSCWVCAEYWGLYDCDLPFRIGGDFGAVGPFPQDRQWRPAIMRTPADLEAHYQWTRRAAQWLASRNDVEVLSMKQYYDRHAEPEGQWLNIGEIQDMARRLLESFDALAAGGTTLSVADALFLLATLGEHVMLHNSLPGKLQVRRTLGPVEAVPEVNAPLTFSRADYLIAARAVYAYTMAHSRIPPTTRAHGINAGPAQVLMALAQAFAQDDLPEQVTVEPLPGLPASADFALSRNATASSIATPAFYDDSTMNLQCKQQSWTYRPLQANV